MASTYSNLGIELIGTGDQSGTWGVTTNTNLGTALEEAIVGTVNQAVTASDLTLPWSTASNATQVARHLRLNLTGSSGGASNLIVPTLASGKNYIIKNSSDTAITVKTAAGTGILVPAGESRSLYQDGTDVVVSDSYHSGTFTGTFIGAGQFTTLSASGAVTGAGITARFASPGPIGNILADTGAFTTLTASGNITLGDATGDSVTFNAATAPTPNTLGLAFTGTGGIKVPAGTTAERPTAQDGMLRYNSTLSSFEGYTAVGWGSVGGGATGAGGDTVFQENEVIVTTSYTLTTGKNAMSVGPITIDGGVTVTVPGGQRWVIL